MTNIQWAYRDLPADRQEQAMRQTTEYLIGRLRAHYESQCDELQARLQIQKMSMWDKVERIEPLLIEGFGWEEFERILRRAADEYLSNG